MMSARELSDLAIRRIQMTDGALLRDLRLRSIADAPSAFGQTLAEAQARPSSEWEQSARRASRGDDRIWLIAADGKEPVGLVQGRRRHPGTLLLFSMWVDPAARRSAVGRRLIEALEAWARGWGAQQTVLWVMAGNQPAIGFYRDLGFIPIARGQDAESGARFGAIAMGRPIDSPT